MTRGLDFIRSAAEAKQESVCPLGFLESSLGCCGGVNDGGQTVEVLEGVGPLEGNDMLRGTPPQMLLPEPLPLEEAAW